jgi:hypothetical protein
MKKLRQKGKALAEEKSLGKKEKLGQKRKDSEMSDSEFSDKL